MDSAIHQIEFLGITRITAIAIYTKSMGASDNSRFAFSILEILATASK